MLIIVEMQCTQVIRRITMIDKKFWKLIADNWSRDSDGIIVPDIGEVPDISPEDLVLFDNISNEEIDDILADLGLDDF